MTISPLISLLKMYLVYEIYFNNKKYPLMGYFLLLIVGFQRVDSPFGRGFKGDSVSLINP